MLAALILSISLILIGHRNHIILFVLLLTLSCGSGFSFRYWKRVSE